MNSLVGRLDFEPIRKVFRHEALDFTTWMEQHLDVLAERLGIELNVVEREKKVGDFNVDLMCEDAAGHIVIIENQLERTDHDHLGKLLTYLVNLDASTAIWVTGDPRLEDQKVIDWLNENTSADLLFYLVKVEAARIAESPFAPLFTVIAAPSEQAKVVGGEKKVWAERQVKNMEFWTELLERSKGRTSLFSSISPGKHPWIGTGAGRSGLTFDYVISKDGASVELYIDHDHQTGEGNKAIFDALHAQREAIEKDFGEPLEWQRLDDRRACRIRKRITDGGLIDSDRWPSLQDKMIESMIRLDNSLRKRLAKLSTMPTT
jgi:hypothetical protein